MLCFWHKIFPFGGWYAKNESISNCSIGIRTLGPAEGVPEVYVTVLFGCKGQGHLDGLPGTGQSNHRGKIESSPTDRKQMEEEIFR